jgi:hypothetical protein
MTNEGHSQSHDHVGSSSIVSWTEEQLQVKADYLESLSDLVVNSKPLINTLTMIAGENATFGFVFIQAIREYYSKTKHKLLVLYLVDSICKNHTADYVPLFTPCIEELFIQGYRSLTDAEEKTRNEFKRVLQTWSKLFPQKIVASIEQRISSDKKPSRISAMPTTRAPHSTGETDLPAYARNDPQYMEQRVAHQQRSETNNLKKRGFEPESDSRARLAGAEQKINPDRLARMKRHRDIPPESSKSHGESSNQIYPPPNPLALLSQLQSLLENERQDASKSAAKPHKMMDTLIRDLPIVELSTSGISKKQFNASHYLYGRLSLQCHQCGMRFSADSQVSLDSHLDQHFRHNKRLSERGNRVLCRSWFLNEQDWILSNTTIDNIESHTDDINADTSSRPDSVFFGESESTTIKSPDQVHKASIITLRQFQSLYSDTTSTKLGKVICSLCQEQFKTLFDPELDDQILCDACIIDQSLDIIPGQSKPTILHTWCASSLTKNQTLGPPDQSKPTAEESFFANK